MRLGRKSPVKDSEVAGHESTLEALSDAEDRAERIVELAFDAFVEMDAAGRITDWNLPAERTFGWRRAEVLGRVFSETVILGDRREAYEKSLARFMAAAGEPAGNKLMETTALHRDGRQFPLELIVTRRRCARGPHYITFARDITH